MRSTIHRSLFLALVAIPACNESTETPGNGPGTEAAATTTGATGTTATGTTTDTTTTTGSGTTTGTTGTGTTTDTTGTGTTAGTTGTGTAGTAGATNTIVGAAGAASMGGSGTTDMTGMGEDGAGMIAAGGADPGAGGADTAVGGADTAMGGAAPDGTAGGMTTDEVDPLDCGSDSCAVEDHGPAPLAGWELAEVLHADSFDDGMERWRAELETGGTVEARDGELVIDVPGGCSVWFEAELEGPLMIEFVATVVGEDGPNDRVSDLNCFWMAQDARNPDDFFSVERSGAFADYDQLRCYYVGYGGNTNSTTRFRRYVGEVGNRPLLPEHDLSDPEYLLEADQPQRIQLIAAGPEIAYFHDDRRVFYLEDPEPYTSGYFAFRTVMNHMRVSDFVVYRLQPGGVAP